jgi:uncharacterized protein (TIGR03435 family)
VAWETEVSDVVSDVAVDQLASVSSAIDKLGLRLEKRRDYVEQIVIDHIEKQPDAN